MRVFAYNKNYLFRKIRSIFDSQKDELKNLPPEIPIETMHTQTPEVTPEPMNETLNENTTESHVKTEEFSPKNFSRIPSCISKINSCFGSEKVSDFLEFIRPFFNSLKYTGVGKKNDFWTIDGTPANFKINFPKTQISGFEIIKQNKSCEIELFDLSTNVDGEKILLLENQSLETSTNFTFSSPIQTNNLNLYATKTKENNFTCLYHYNVLIEQ